YSQKCDPLLERRDVNTDRFSGSCLEAQLSFDKSPYSALSKIYTVDIQVAESANTAIAYLGGVKANYGTQLNTCYVSPEGMYAHTSNREWERIPKCVPT
ncbi:Alk phosphatase domain containing protein, partial [Asbolus verrucosus]